MPSHPDADAFMRGYLRTPTDITARLVFADWLEETDTPANRAWAYYIRVKAEADRHPRGSPERWGLDNQAVGYAPRIRARLTIPARHFVGYPKSLLELLPAPNITVRLDGFTVPPGVRAMIPEVVARENLIFPLDVQGWVLLIALPDPHDEESLKRLRFLTNREVVAVRAAADDIAAAIDRHYGQTESDWVGATFTEYVEPLWLTPPASPDLAAAVSDDDGPVARFVNHVLFEAFTALGADAVVIAPGPDAPVLRYRVGGTWITREPIPDRLLVPVAGRIAAMAGMDVGPVFDPRVAAVLGPAIGRIPFRVRDESFLVDVSIELTPDGPVIELELVREPEPAA